MRAPALGNDNARAAAQADKQPHQQIDKGARGPPPPPARWCPQSCRRSAYPPCCTAAGTACRTRSAKKKSSSCLGMLPVRISVCFRLLIAHSLSHTFPILCYFPAQCNPRPPEHGFVLNLQQFRQYTCDFMREFCRAGQLFAQKQRHSVVQRRNLLFCPTKQVDYGEFRAFFALFCRSD